MNLTNNSKQLKQTKRSPRKTIDIILLILIVAFGILAGIVLFLPNTLGWIDPLLQRFSKVKKDFPAMPDLRIGRKNAKLTFRGIMTGEKGTLAIVNDEMAAVGEEFEGVRIVGIQGHTLTIEYQGEEYPLTTGQTFSYTTD